MKILLVITKADFGGAQVVVKNIAMGMKSHAHDVVVGYGEPGGLVDELKILGIPTIQLKRLKRTNNVLSNILYVLELRRLLKFNHFDIVHLHSSNALFGILSARLIGRGRPKVVFTVHGLSLLDKNYKLSIIYRGLYYLYFKLLLKFLDERVFVSQSNLKYAQLKKICSSGQVVYCGLPALEFYPREISRSLFSKQITVDINNDYIFGAIGRLSYQKNFEFLIKNFKEILKIKPNSKLIIIGDGNYRAKLENQIIQLKLTKCIYLLGGISNASQYIKAFDLFVLPSRYEGLPITIIESMQAGVPCLVSDVGGNYEIVGPECLYKLDDINDFLKKASKQITDPALCFLNSERFSLESMISEYEKIFLNLLQ